MAWIIGNVDIGRISQRGVDLDLPGMQTGIATLQADMAVVQADVATAQANIAVAQADIGVLQATVATMAQVIEAWDAKPYGTIGGASIIGIQTRQLNTLGINTIPGASLVANQITLPAGTYRASAYTVIWNGAGNHQAALWNVTDNTLIAVGMSIMSIAYDQNSMAFVSKRFTLALQKVIELRAYIQYAVSTGLGKNSSATFPGGTEIYSFIQIEKVS